MDSASVGHALGRLHALFLESYDRQSLSELLLFRMNQVLAHKVAEGTDFRTVVLDLLAVARREGWLLDLAREAGDRRVERKPEWAGAVADLEAALSSHGDSTPSVAVPHRASGRLVPLDDCPPDVLVTLTQRLVAAAGPAVRGAPTVQVIIGDWTVRVEVNVTAYDTWGATAGLDSIGRRVAGHRRQIDYYQKQKLGPFAAGVDYDRLIGEQSTELTAALQEMADRLRPFVRAVWRSKPELGVTR